MTREELEHLARVARAAEVGSEARIDAGARLLDALLAAGKGRYTMPDGSTEHRASVALKAWLDAVSEDAA